MKTTKIMTKGNKRATRTLKGDNSYHEALEFVYANPGKDFEIFVLENGHIVNYEKLNGSQIRG